MNVAIVAVRTPISAVVVDVDIDVMAVPIAAVREPRADGNAGRKHYDRGRIGMFDHHNIWIVSRHVNHGGAC